MSEKKNRSLGRPGVNNAGFFNDLINNFRLIVRLIKDSRINPLLKLLPIGAFIYLIVPIDLLSLNPIDDGLVLWLGGYLFIELCPDEIVNEHRKAIRQSKGDDPGTEASSNVVEGEFREVSSK